MLLTDNEISGWKADTSTYPTGWNFMPDTIALMNMIDGMYALYARQGWKNGIVQTMESSSALFYQGDVFDFGTETNATQMYQVQKDAHGSGIDSMRGFSKSVAFGSSVLGGGMIFAHKTNLYFELAFTGFDSTASAYDTGRVFLKKFFSKIP